MKKNNMKKIKSAVVSSVIAVSAMAAPLSTAVLPNMTASAANDNYAKLLQYSLYFYDANMCGKNVGEESALTWRDDCHTSDAVDGGFHDAGDHVKFGLPAGYSASTLGWSYYEFKDSFDSTGQSAHLKTITDHFAEFFRNSTTLSGDTVTNFVYQVGDGDADHAEWCPPEVQGSSSRKTFSTTSGASDIAASYAAALAVNYVNFGNTDDLKYAKALFDFSTKYNQKATDGTGGFYDSWDYYDDQAWAAGWLYRATNDNKYKEFLNTYMNSSNQGSSGMDGCQWGIYSTMSWNNVSMGAGILQAEITGDSADWKKVTEYLNGHGANSNNYYFENQWGSARYNAAQQMTALVATKYGAASYNEWSKGQMDYIMGNKGVGSASPKCFVVGLTDNSPKNPHHRAASGYSSYDEMGDSTQSSPNGHTLVGALVGGPIDENGTYNDTLKDYIANEVALDYNAGLVGAAAGLYSVYKSGTPDTSIEGVGSVSSGTVDTPQTSQTTQNTPDNTTTTTTTTKIPTQSSSGFYSISPNKQVVYDKNADDKMIGFEWSQFNIPATEKVKKVEITISSNSGNVGKWQGAFGSSTSVAPDYWTQGDDMEVNISGNSGTITWEVPASTADIIQYNYGGELKFGTWWVDCGNFTVDSIKVYTDAYSGSSAVTPTTTTSTTRQPSGNTTTTTTTNQNQSSSSSSGYKISPNKQVVYDKNSDDKMIGFEWSQFNIPATEKVKKVEITISSNNGNIGKWQGAFGSSTSVAPDYWAQGDDMEQTISGNRGTITWEVPSSISDIIQYQYGGELKFGTWWVDCGDFTIESINVITNGSSQQQATTTTTKPNTSSGNVNYGDANVDGSVNISDAVLIMQSIANPDEFKVSDQGKLNGDVIDNGSGLTNVDALAIQYVEIKTFTSSVFPMSSADLEKYQK